MDGKQTNTIHTHDDEKRSNGVQRDDEKQYPPMKIVLPAMAATYLAMFLIAIVNFNKRADFLQ
jgi:Zn-dependent membrane protease YugP